MKLEKIVKIAREFGDLEPILTQTYDLELTEKQKCEILGIWNSPRYRWIIPTEEPKNRLTVKEILE